jgi:hypothetical protein
MKPLQRGENIVDREKNNISKTGKKRKNMREGRSRGQGKRRKKEPPSAPPLGQPPHSLPPPSLLFLHFASPPLFCKVNSGE